MIMSGPLRNFFGQLFGQTSSGNVSITVAAMDRVLTLSADRTAIKVGEVVRFQGGYTVGGRAAGADIELFKNGVSTGQVVHTAEYGSYEIQWVAGPEDEKQDLSFYTEARD